MKTTFNLNKERIYFNKISSHKHNKNIKYELSTDNVSFTGLLPDNDIKKLKMFVFDLDDTLLNGTDNDIKEVLDNTKGKIVVYASAKRLKELLQVAGDGKKLPLPDYFIANNGQFIYKRKNNDLVEMEDWALGLREQTGFDREKVYSIMKNLAQKYHFSNEELNQKSNLNEYKEKNPDFWNSKISFYEFYPSNFFQEFMVAPGIGNILKEELPALFKKNGIKARFTFNTYPKSNLDTLDKYFPDNKAEDIRDKARPLRIYKQSDTARYPDHQLGDLDTVHIGAGEKGDAVEFLRKQLGIKPKNVLAVGDDKNDVSLTDKGYWFVFINNASDTLRNFIDNLNDFLKSKILKASKDGAAGILEAINLKSEN
ncbi:MAG: hypothetical protein A2287_00700 [Candidatus Melainabacteria bacterium RIFOXYA12_FULL_32_12]|nr:MAG: hypothetical protein A2287_00700 [Candidatus Melainabacteria bacterium RIFOXYA12_FULL_32_12]